MKNENKVFMANHRCIKVPIIIVLFVGIYSIYIKPICIYFMLYITNNYIYKFIYTYNKLFGIS
jgi:hypothetical protein